MKIACILLSIKDDDAIICLIFNFYIRSMLNQIIDFQLEIIII